MTFERSMFRLGSGSRRLCTNWSDPSQAMLVVGLLIEERPRSLRSESAPKLKRLFEVISEYGGLRVPLSAVLSEDDTVMALVAVPAAARAAGLEAIWSADKAEIGTATMSLFMSRPISAQMTILSAFEEGLHEAQDEQFIDRLAEAVLNEEGKKSARGCARAVRRQR